MDLGEVKKGGGDLDGGDERCLPGGPWGGTATGSKSQRLEGHSRRPPLHLAVLVQAGESLSHPRDVFLYLPAVQLLGQFS